MLKIGNFTERFFTITFLIGVALLLSFSAHKYYASITKIEISEQEQLIKVYTQVFVDDFEDVLEERYQLNAVDFENLSGEEEKHIATYVAKKIQLKVNRQPLKLKFLGCEAKNELLYIFVEAPIKEIVKRFDVENTMLQDLFSEQQNTIDITNNSKTKSLHLYAENPSGTIYY